MPSEDPKVHVSYEGSSFNASVTIDGKALPVERAEIVMAGGELARLVLTLTDFTTSAITSDLAKETD